MQYQKADKPTDVLSAPVIAPGHTFGSITEKISEIVLTSKISIGWLLALSVAMGFLGLMLLSLLMLFTYGIGIWGVNNPVGWGFAIINLVWWIGIGHAGTLISAILLLFRQEWRTSINRFAEAMTLFAVACAGLFPIVHTGRPWLAYWLVPHPNTMGMWPQFRSPLVWDVFAISTYATVSLLFWYVGLIPDLATLRDRAKNLFVRYVYGIFALGWRGSALHWKRFNTAYLLLAALATPLVVSVHTVVSFDFAVSVVPGWHVTVFPPYFVAGAVFSGFAMVLTLTIPIRKIFGLEDFITMRHLNNMAKIMLATGLFVVYGYTMEFFFGWYSANEFDRFLIFDTRLVGPLSWSFYALIFCNAVVPQLLWFSQVRSSPVILWIISIVVNIGMWLERFVIVVISLHRDYLPAAWDIYIPTFWDITLYVGTLGLFSTLLIIFIRVLPMISIFELRELAHHKSHEGEH